MATVIKAQHANLPRGAAFNFDDLSRQAQGYLGEVQQKAREILAQAQKEAETIRQRAEKEGREAGQRTIEKLSAEQVAKEMKTVLPAMQQAIDGLIQSRHAWLAHWEQRGIGLATAIAERIIRREVQRQPEIALALVREGLEMAAGASQVTLRMNPADLQTLSSQIQQLTKDSARLAPLELLADATITRGGCRLELRHGAIDHQIESQLQRIEEELISQ